MKKTIKILTVKMNKLQEKKDGHLEGGFASIKGGYNYSNTVNEYCSNTGNCTQYTNFCPGNPGVCVI
ncbi:hypothetical protein [Longitalea arenae]|uniref:hypothetical protein n=1 Tax=Longitalea arenae TaxID=2812558 RepID=UPI00196864B4|nr:hypothetical protein [Longitalea arenae]